MRLRTRSSEVAGLPWLSMTLVTALVISALVVFRTELFDAFQSHLGRSEPAAEGLGLRVSRAGGDLRIAWSRAAPAVASARDASLLIRDGDQQHALKLSSAELRAGEVVYQPVSSDVVLRLEIDDGAGRRATETTSVLGLTPRLGRVARPPRTPLPARQLRAAAKPQPKPVAPPPARPQHRPAPRAPEQDHFSTPEPYPAALSSIVGTVRVDARVTTDARGDVRRAELVSPGPSAYFAKLALEAARASRLRPGAESAVLHYEFTPDGVRITRLQGAPAGAR